MVNVKIEYQRLSDLIVETHIKSFYNVCILLYIILLLLSYYITDLTNCKLLQVLSVDTHFVKIISIHHELLC
jgi:hypothetical protein